MKFLIRLKGGLGNQMFQFAFAYALQKATGCKIKFFFDDPNQNVCRKLMLNDFNIMIPIASDREIKRFRYVYSQIPEFLTLTLIRRKFILKDKLIKRQHAEPSFNYNKANLELSENSIVDGYWQSYHYFNHLSPCLNNLFTPKIYFKETISFEKKIKKASSTAIHVRRGDYVHDSKTSNYHGLCDLGYYKRAINVISKKIRNTTFYIFSDDLEWVEKNFKFLNNKVFIYFDNSITQDTEVQELYLMSICDNQIIANSTFSWWGAWLNTCHNKIVVAPLNWFSEDKIDTSDLIPLNWIRV